MSEYLTIKKEGVGEYKDRGSKFIGFARPATNRMEAEQEVKKLQKEYHDARHHCYALVCGEDHSIYFANDDGEPAHSAGDPILGQIRSRNLTHVVVVVIRYFGGTKLGVPGLIQAYKTAAEYALLDAGIKTVEIKEHFWVTYPYESTSQIEKLIHHYQLTVESQEFTDRCKSLLSIRAERFSEVKKELDVMLAKEEIGAYHQIEMS